MTIAKVVAPHIYQVTLKLPFALNHVHCYILDDGDGWTIIDAGLHLSQSERDWLAVFDQLKVTPQNLKRIILTHTHPDHYGLAGWLQAWGQGDGPAELAPPVIMSAREKHLSELVWGASEEQIKRMSDHFYKCGLDREMADTVAVETKFVAARTLPHPHTVHTVEYGGQIKMAQRDFTIIHAPGHSDGQLTFHCEDDGLFLSGDHVLMKITPNISLWSESIVDPLGDYLNSLNELRDLNVSLALPGHRDLIHDWSGRINELIIHHDHRLQDTLEGVTLRTTVRDVAMYIFRLEQLTTHEARFALTEALAHLEYLVIRQQLARETIDNQWCYRRLS